MAPREQKTEIVTIRVTPSQKILLENAATLAGISVSSLLLLNGLHAARRVSQPQSLTTKRSKQEARHD